MLTNKGNPNLQLYRGFAVRHILENKSFELPKVPVALKMHKIIKGKIFDSTIYTFDFISYLGLSFLIGFILHFLINRRNLFIFIVLIFLSSVITDALVHYIENICHRFTDYHWIRISGLIGFIIFLPGAVISGLIVRHIRRPK